MPTDGPSVKGTILVVDDEPAVRRVLLMRLQLAGYNVVSAEDGEEALEKFHSGADPSALDQAWPHLDHGDRRHLVCLETHRQIPFSLITIAPRACLYRLFGDSNQPA